MSVTFIIVATLVVYFFVLLFVSRRTERRAGASEGAEGASRGAAGAGRAVLSAGNDAFFRAGRNSAWWMVAFGMIGASISGVTFISVPGWAGATGMTYLQMCAGFIPGYFIVAFVLLPLYYRLQLTSIYSYLAMRFGASTHRTGAFFFILSKLTGAAARLYLVCLVLETFLVGTGRFAAPDAPPLLALLPFLSVVVFVLLLIWLYTRRAGLQTIVRTDALQTLCMLLALVGLIFAVTSEMDLSLAQAVRFVAESDMSRVWCFEADSPQNFWRQFFSGLFIVVVMTGLDQDMMQKNLSCRTLREAQKNMCTYGLAFLPVNLLFLALGVLLYAFSAQSGAAAGVTGDALLPTLVSSGALGVWVVAPFTLGICAAAFSSADSALTALTTTACIDLIGIERRGYPAHRAEQTRRRVHLVVTLLFVMFIVAFRVIGSQSVINAIYVMASYTYGPLLGLFAFGLFTRRRVIDRYVPVVAVLSPAVCALLDAYAPVWWGYRFGYELLMLNGVLTFAGCLLLSKGRFEHA